MLTQADVDDFATDYPGCTNLQGGLIIGPSTDITNLNGLSGIVSVVGLSVQQNNALPNLSGLTSLTSITGGTIDIRNNPQLSAIDISYVSAPSLTKISVYNNTSLTSLKLPSDASITLQ